MACVRRALRNLLILAAVAVLTAGQAFAANVLKVVPATGAVGSDVTVKVTLDVDKDIAAAAFNVAFDPAKLVLKEVAKGAAAASMTMTDPTVFIVSGQNVAADSGKLEVQMIDSTLANPIQSGTDREVLLLTFTVAAGASGDIPVTLSSASLSDNTGGSVTVTTTDGMVTVGTVALEAVLSVGSAQAPAGADVTLKVTANASSDVEAMAFSLVFNQQLVTIKSVARGADAPGLIDTLDALTDIATANANGKMDVYLVNYYYGVADSSKVLPSGNNRNVYSFTFTIASDAPDGDVPVTLSGVELVGVVSGVETDFTTTVHAGKITVGGKPGDVSGDGKIDVFDLLGLLKVMSGSTPATAMSDVNGDGKTDVFDLLALLKILAGG